MTKLTDQIIHFAVPVALLLAFFHGGVLGGAVAGLGCGLIREFSEAGGSRIEQPEIVVHFLKLDPWIDLIFWTLGGAFAAALVG